MNPFFAICLAVSNGYRAARGLPEIAAAQEGQSLDEADLDDDTVPYDDDEMSRDEMARDENRYLNRQQADYNNRKR